MSNQKDLSLNFGEKMINVLKVHSSSNSVNVDLPGITFLVDENTDFELLFLLQNLKKLNNNVNIYSVDYQKSSNFDLLWKFDKIRFFQQDIKNCFLFTSNIRVENALLHLRMYVKSLNKYFTVLQFNGPNTSKFLTSVINLNTQNTFTFFEGKEFFSSYRVLPKTSLFLFGFSFVNKISFVFLNLLSFLKINFPNSIFLKLDKKSNSAIFSFLNIPYYNFKKVAQSNLFFFNSLEKLNHKTNFFLKNSLNSIYEKKSNFWFHSHISNNLFLNVSNKYKILTNEMSLNSVYFVPSLTSLEFEGIYFNLENRPQNTQIIRTPTYQTLLLKNLLNDVFLKSKGYLANNLVFRTSKVENNILIKHFNLIPEFYFTFELIKNFSLFNTIQNNYSLLSFLNLESLPVYEKCNKYPLKLQSENFHTNSTFLYNSINMQNYQNKVSKLFNNF
jgi:hypothetical protein